MESIQDRSDIHVPLPNLGAIIMRSKHTVPTLVFTKNYGGFLLYSLFNFIEKLSSVSDTQQKSQYLYSILFNENVKNFVFIISQKLNHRIKTNWFLKVEIHLLLNLMKASIKNKFMDDKKLVILQSAYRLLSCFSQEMFHSILYLFDKIIFNIEYYERNDLNIDDEMLQKWKNIYSDTILSSLNPSKVRNLCYLYTFCFVKFESF